MRRHRSINAFANNRNVALALRSPILLSTLLKHLLKHLLFTVDVCSWFWSVVADILVLKDLIQDASGRKSEFKHADLYVQLHSIL